MKKSDLILQETFKYREALIIYAYSIIRDWTLAEDALQNAFVVVMDKWEDFKEGTNIFKWVKQIVHYKALHILRDRKHEYTYEEEQLSVIISKQMDDSCDPKWAEDQNKMEKALEICIEKLNSYAIDLLSGFYWQNETCKELAKKHNKSMYAVQKYINRLRTKLKACIDNRMQTMES